MKPFKNFKAWMLFAVWMVFLLCTGCQEKQQREGTADRRNTLAAQMESGDAIVIYLSGIPHDFITEDGRFTMYPSKYTVGLSAVGGEMNDMSGNAFAQALTEYSQETGVPVEIHFLEEFSGVDPLQELYDQGGEMPDLLIVGKHTRYDYDTLAKQGILLDFKTYTDQDAEWQDEEVYYSKVLQGGKLEKGQYAIPILFNLNGMITSDSYLKEIGMATPEKTISYEDVLQLLQKSCIEMKNSKTKEAIYDANGMPAGRYIPSILTAAAYPEYVEDAEGILKSSTVKSILQLMQDFNQQEFVNIIGWEENTYFNNVNGKTKSVSINRLGGEVYDHIGVFLSGGRCGGANFYNSFLADAVYFHSLYEKNGDTAIVRGIPTVQDPQAYSANISLMAFAFESTQYPEIAYDIARYLMNYEFPLFYGFSINQELTEKQLQEAQETTSVIYPDWVWSSYVAGDMNIREAKEQIEEIDPLDGETVAIIQNMLDHIAGAGLPCNIVEYYLYASALNAIGDAAMQPAEAAEWLLERWENHLQIQKDLEPFYDAAYIASLRLDAQR